MLGSAELDDDRGIWSDWPGKFDAHVFFSFSAASIHTWIIAKDRILRR